MSGTDEVLSLIAWAVRHALDDDHMHDDGDGDEIRALAVRAREQHDKDRAEIARLRAALAAGPAALREFGDEEMTARTAAAHVEAAQRKAMGET
jgi:anti-sigma factor RsiW